MDSETLNDSPTDVVPEIENAASPSSVLISTDVAANDSEKP